MACKMGSFCFFFSFYVCRCIFLVLQLHENKFVSYNDIKRWQLQG